MIINSKSTGLRYPVDKGKYSTLYYFKDEGRHEILYVMISDELSDPTLLVNVNGTIIDENFNEDDYDWEL